MATSIPSESTMPLRMLQQANIQSNEFYSRVDKQMSESLALQVNRDNAELNATLKGVQFAEQKRMNDAKIENARAVNLLRAQEAEAAAELNPLKIEVERMKIKAYQSREKNQAQKEMSDTFNLMTKPIDQQMGSHFLQSGSVEHVRAYLDLKGRTLAGSLAGKDFNDIEFMDEVRKLNAQYTDYNQDTSDKFDPQMHYLLGTFDEVAQKEYSLRNPINKANVASSALTFVTSNDEKIVSSIQKDQFGNTIPLQLAGQLTIYRNAYQNNQKKIESKQRDIDKLYTAIPLTLDNKEQSAFMRNRITDLENEVAGIEKQNFDLTAKLSNNDFSPVQEAVVEQTGPDPSEYTPSREPVMGVSSDSVSKTLRMGLTEVASIIAGEPVNSQEDLSRTILSDLSFTWFENNASQGDLPYDTLNSIKRRIEAKVDSFDYNDIDRQIHPDKINKLLERVTNPVDVPVSPWLAEAIKKNMSSSEWRNIVQVKRLPGEVASGMIPEDGSEMKASIEFGSRNDVSQAGVVKRTLGVAQGVGTYDVFMRIIKAMPTKASKEEASRELFSSLTTAALGDALSNR